MIPVRLPLCLLACILFVACQKPAAPPAAPADPHAHDGESPDRLELTEAVRRNLGIGFVKVERRALAQTLRMPGHFELLPAGRHEHRVPVEGRVEVLVAPLQPVSRGDLLYRLDSPTWRRVQQELGEIVTALRVHEARAASMQPLVAAHRVHEDSLREAVTVMDERVRGLDATRASVGGQAQELAAARVQLAQIRAELAEAAEKRASTEAELAGAEANTIASRDRFRLALDAAATLVGIEPDQLLEEGEGAKPRLPRWRLIRSIEVRATATGVVDHLPVATGVWVEAGNLILTVTDAAQVRFRARALQSDLLRLRSGLPAQVVPAGVGAAALPGLPGALSLGVEADPAQRTVDVFLQPTAAAAWARPGVAAFLEVQTAGTREPVLAVPSAAVQPDGLRRFLFRRDRADADAVQRLEADLGLDDGRWVEIRSGLADGDEIVLAGAYELMLATSGTAGKAGHVHADGTFHDGEHK